MFDWFELSCNSYNWAISTLNHSSSKAKLRKSREMHLWFRIKHLRYLSWEWKQLTLHWENNFVNSVRSFTEADCSKRHYSPLCLFHNCRFRDCRCYHSANLTSLQMYCICDICWIFKFSTVKWYNSYSWLPWNTEWKRGEIYCSVVLLIYVMLIYLSHFPLFLFPEWIIVFICFLQTMNTGIKISKWWHSENIEE